MSDIPDPSDGKLWRLKREDTWCWRAWDEEIVVYDDLSGDTMKLNPYMSETLRCLQQAPASEAAITRHLAETLEADADSHLQRWVARAIERFERVGLVEAVTVPEQTGQGG